VAAAAEAALEDIEANAHRDDALVVSILAGHAPALLRTARRYSRDADDAQDAYQRALEIFVRRAGRLRRETAVNWLHQVVKHEALAVCAAEALAGLKSQEVLRNGRRDLSATQLNAPRWARRRRHF
jgi:DNA-directed RNA polymerase specialized sigma24 family protein